MPNTSLNIDPKTYISALDNPHITAEMAYDYFFNNRQLFDINQEVLDKASKSDWTYTLKNEPLNGRLEEIAALLADADLGFENLMLSSINVQRAFFKMALPQHRLTRDNENEIYVCVRALDFNNFKNISDLFLTHDNVFSKQSKNDIAMVAKMVCWSGTSVGSFILFGENIENKKYST